MHVVLSTITRRSTAHAHTLRGARSRAQHHPGKPARCDIRSTKENIPRLGAASHLQIDEHRLRQHAILRVLERRRCCGSPTSTHRNTPNRIAINDDGSTALSTATHDAACERRKRHHTCVASSIITSLEAECVVGCCRQLACRRRWRRCNASQRSQCVGRVECRQHDLRRPHTNTAITNRGSSGRRRGRPNLGVTHDRHSIVDVALLVNTLAASLPDAGNNHNTRHRAKCTRTVYCALSVARHAIDCAIDRSDEAQEQKQRTERTDSRPEKTCANARADCSTCSDFDKRARI